MEIEALTEQVIKFRKERNWKLWKRHQKPKDFALALIAEAAELAEHFK